MQFVGSSTYSMWNEGSFVEVKRPEREADHPPQSSAEVKERVKLYFYTAPGLHGLFQGELNLYFTFNLSHVCPWVFPT